MFHITVPFHKIKDEVLDDQNAHSKTVFYKHIELDSDLEEITSIFDENDIFYEVFSSNAIIDEVIVGTGFFSKYTLKIYPNAFQKANKLISEHNGNRDLSIDDFEYLKELTDQELLGILENPLEWSVESEIIARKF